MFYCKFYINIYKYFDFIYLIALIIMNVLNHHMSYVKKL